VRRWDAQRVARTAGATLQGELSAFTQARGPGGAGVDSRSVEDGELFVGLRGERTDGGRHAVQALRAGAWGALVAPEHARDAVEAQTGGAVLSHPDPLRGLQALARARREELGGRGARVVAITGSTGKTSTKDILDALLSRRLRTAVSPRNFNTEIGLPLAILAAPGNTEVLVLEMAMRGSGQIAELTAIAEPDVGVIVNVGPAHLELLGSLEAIAAAKSELIAGLAPAATIVLPAGEPLLAAHLRGELRTVTFGEGGDVRLLERHRDGRVRIGDRGEEMDLRPSFGQAHNLRNLLAAVAAARALGITPEGSVEVRFSAMRGERHALAGGVLLIDDCYNANPMSMRAAIDDLAETAAGRRVAVLGDMLELGVDAPRMHREIGEHAGAAGVELLVTVGPLAREMALTFPAEAHTVADAPAAAELLEGLLREEDTVLVKGSRGVGLERVLARLRAGAGTVREGERDGGALAPSGEPGLG
jgi:UDP-N-acetylmuramoyl-tripeptide--D-alanyl-D-alanine ligase